MADEWIILGCHVASANTLKKKKKIIFWAVMLTGVRPTEVTLYIPTYLMFQRSFVVCHRRESMKKEKREICCKFQVHGEEKKIFVKSGKV